MLVLKCKRLYVFVARCLYCVACCGFCVCQWVLVVGWSMFDVCCLTFVV